MHSQVQAPNQRQRLILQLLSEKNVPSQAELGRLLRGKGHAVTQATLSRDLRFLSVRKGPKGYELPAGGDPLLDSPQALLASQVRSWLTSIALADNQLVLKTPPGGAQALAIALDGAELPGVLGTIAGDDTILVINKSATAARRTSRELQGLSERL